MDNGFLFTRPLTYEIKDNGDLIVVGNISTTHPDLVNDIVTLKCLKSMQKQIQEGNLKIDLEHEAFRGDTSEEKELNKTKIPVGRMIEPTITETKTDKGIMHGLSVKVLFNKEAKTYEATKSNIVNKFLDAFSIAYIPTEMKNVTRNGETFRQLDDLRLLNTALTGNPVNTTAQMTQIFTKSLDALEQYKADKKLNPELSDLLEVKGNREARNQAVSEGEEEEEDEEGEEEKGSHKKKKKYPSKKAYEKDGAHAHTDDEPLGLHNHPEIEMQVRELWDFIFEMQRPIEGKGFAGFSSFDACVSKMKKDGKSDESAKKICGKLQAQSENKSHSNENNNNYKEVKMTEENEKPVEAPEAAPEKEVEKEANSGSEKVLDEVKSLIASLKSDIAARFDKLEAKDEEEVEAPKKEAKSKVLGAENSDSQNLKAERAVAGGLSLIR